MTKNIYTVAQVNNYIKNMFAQDFMLHKISVSGEVSNCKYHTSGHIYFTIKDGGSALNAIMFAGNRRGLTFPMQNGDHVVVTVPWRSMNGMGVIRFMRGRSQEPV